MLVSAISETISVGAKGRPDDGLPTAFWREQIFTQVEEHEHCG